MRCKINVARTKSSSAFRTSKRKPYIFFLLALGLVALSPLEIVAATPDTTNLQAGSTFRDCPNCPEIVVVPPGNFLMGTTKEDIHSEIKEIPEDERTVLIPFLIKTPEDHIEQELPQHRVQISHPFGLGKYPITYEEFFSFVQDTGYRTEADCSISMGRYFRRARGSWLEPGFTPNKHDPIVCVNSHDVEAYIAWLNTKLQNSSEIKNKVFYRLPSEAEWEYAARAGSQTAYWWGNSIGVNHAVCRECGSPWDNRRPTPVGSFPPNQFGLYDMLGDVWEETADCWNQSYSSAPTDGSPWMTGDCKKYVIRGGAWDNDAWTLRSASRGSMPLDLRGNNRGFRVLRELP